MQRLAYSVREVSALTGLSTRTISRQIKQGRLRSVHVSRRVLIPAQALAEFLDGSARREVPSFNAWEREKAAVRP